MQQLAPHPHYTPALHLVPPHIADLLASSPLAVHLYDAGGTSAWMNEANRALFGLPSVTYGIGRFHVLSAPWTITNGHVASYRRAYDGELVFLPEVVINHGDPENQWASSRATKVLSQLLLPLPDEAGAVRGLLTFTVDRAAPLTTRAELDRLHEHLDGRSVVRTAELAAALARLEAEVAARRRAEAALADREALTSALFANASVGMALVNDRGEVVLANEAFAHFLASEPADLLGIELATLIHPEDVDLDLTARADLVAGRRRSYTVDQRFLTREDCLVWGHLSVTVLHGGAAEALLFVVVCEDITFRIRAEEERLRLSRRLQEAQRLESIGILAGGVAHDFNNILTSIQGNADLAMLSLPEDSLARPYLDQIAEAVVRATELTRQMFAYAGRRRALAPLTDVNEAIGAFGDLLRSGPARGCDVRLHLGSGLQPVLIEATQVRQIVMNLVLNAAEAFCEQGGTISVSTGHDELGRCALDGLILGDEARSGPFVRITVSDDGPGMALDTLDRIFDPFFTTKLFGRGLGLASVHAIVRDYHGALWVESALGCGTTFHIWLPAAPCG